METHFCPYCMTPVAEGETCSACGLTAGNYSPAPHHLPPGTVLLSRYLIGRVLGEGGFGITYIGCDLRLEMKVAIKEYFPTDKATRHAGVSLAVESYTGSSADGYAAGKTKFLREARTMARMDKQKLIVGVRDFFEENNTAYIVMEYVQGTTFKELVRQKGGRIPAGELLHMIEPLFPALETMHQKGLIHRDISPDNLMLEDGEVRLLDFGCARESSRGTETMTIALKHGYAPIEQYQHKGQGPWTDVYALCGTIYYCLTGKVPPQALDRLCGDELILPRKLGVDLTENQERALLYGMGIRPAHRYQSVQELYAALYTGVPAPKPREERLEFSQFPREPVPEPKPEPGPDTELPKQPRPEEENTAPEEEQGVPEEEQDAPEEEKSAPEPKKPEKRPLRKRIWIPAACAAVLCAAGALALIPRGAAPVPTEPVQVGATEPEEAASEPGETAFDPEVLFAGAVRMTAGENGVIPEAEFRALLSDGGAPSVILPEGSNTFVSSMEFLDITKPVLLEEGAYLTVQGETCLSGPNACLYVKGDFSPEGITRTEGGGKLVLADKKSSDISTRALLLLENREDLVQMGQGVLDVFENHIVSFDRDGVFADAVRVSDENSLWKALEDPEVSAVTVEGNVSADVSGAPTGENQLLYCNKPLRIAPGAVLTVTGGEIYLDNREEGRGLLVNDGTLRAGLNTAGDALVLNYALWEGGIFGADTTILVNSGSGEIRLIAGFRPNMGTYNCFGDEFQFYNLGQLSLSHHGEETLACDIGGVFFNYGSFSVAGSARAAIGSSNQGSQAWNYGSISVVDGGDAENTTFLMNAGTIRVGDGCGFTNRGLIHNRGTAEGPLSNQSGVFLSENEVTENIWQGLKYRLIPEEGRTEVSTAAQLLAAQEDPSVSAVCLRCRVVLDEDLTLTKPLTIAWDGGLEVGGTLTVDGTCLYRENNDGLLKTRELVLVNGAALAQAPLLPCQNGGYITDAAALRVESGSAYVHGNSGSIGVGTESIALSGGGNFFNLAPLSGLTDTSLTVGSGCTFFSSAPMAMDSGNIHVEENGFLDARGCCDFGRDVTLTNHGWVQLEGKRQERDGIYDQYLPAEIQNYGRFCHDGQILYLTGKVVNYGKIYAGVDSNNDGMSSIQIGSGGSLSGNGITEYEWDFDWMTG